MALLHARPVAILLGGYWLLFGQVAASQGVNVFSMPTGQTSLQFVPVGDPGNAPDLRPTFNRGLGSVPYTYGMGKYDVTVAQYAAFLTAVAQNDTHGLYHQPSYIQRSGTSGNYTFTPLSGTANNPMSYVPWEDCLRFANWLSNGQPTGPQNASTTEDGSYTMGSKSSFAELLTITRNPGAHYVLPSTNEWYKAAYYKGHSADAGYWTYPTCSDVTPSNQLSATGTNNANFWSPQYGYTDHGSGSLTPVGSFAASPGPYGTFDMAGDILQFTDSRSDVALDVRGGCYQNPPSTFASDNRIVGYGPAYSYYYIGFRVVEIPEPSTVALAGVGAVALLWRRGRISHSRAGLR